jgi:hypothetical protein
MRKKILFIRYSIKECHGMTGSPVAQRMTHHKKKPHPSKQHCWEGYRKVGMKNGAHGMVNNCVKKKH